MLESKLMLCAQNVVIDINTNYASAFNILDQMPVRGFPFAIPGFAVFSIMERTEDEEGHFICELRMSFNGNEMPGIPNVEVDFQGNLRNRLTLVLEGLTIQEPGVLKFTLACNNNELDSTEVRFAPAEAKPRADVRLQNIK